MWGLYNIDKPRGRTSRDVVDHVQKLVRPAKAGHAGTLDPLASGVLVVCVGAATRLVEHVQRLQKQYVAAFLLGHASDTDDVEGHVVVQADARRPSQEELATAVGRFVGEMPQRPPAFSAVKVHGQRAYQLARAGQPFVLGPRPVRIDRIELLSYAYPEVRVEVHCGSGTYIRALGRDLATSLGTTAVMSELTRTAIGSYHVSEACPLDQLNAATKDQRLLPVASVFVGRHVETLSSDDVERVRNGQALPKRSHGHTDEVPAVDPQGRLVAILAPRNADWLQPVRVFPPTG